MFRHNDVADDHEAVADANLFKNGKETVAGSCGVQKRQSPVARPSDKVQVMSAIGAMQTAGHQAHGTSSIVPALAKNARTGHPQFRSGKRNQISKAGPPVFFVNVESDIVKIVHRVLRVSFLSRRRVAHALNFAGITNAAGAPSLRFLQGREFQMPAVRAFAFLTPHGGETKSRSNPRSPAQVQLPRADKNDSCSNPTVPAIPPIPALPGCDACT